MRLRRKEDGKDTKNRPRPSAQLNGHTQCAWRFRRPQEQQKGQEAAGESSGRPRRIATGRQDCTKTGGPPKSSQKDTARPRMCALGRSNAKKERDLRGKGWGCGRGEEKMKRILKLKQKINYDESKGTRTSLANDPTGTRYRPAGAIPQRLAPA